jgi:hypothetical protein
MALCIAAPGCLLTAPSEKETTGGCPATQKFCDGRCVALHDPEFGCAPGSCTPCHLTRANAVTCVGDTCGVVSCEPGFENCNDLADDGCEAELARDPAHCARCRNSCADGMCVNGSCCKPSGIACTEDNQCCGDKCVSDSCL